MIDKFSMGFIRLPANCLSNFNLLGLIDPVGNKIALNIPFEAIDYTA